MSILWDNVKSQDVLKAIELFDQQGDSYPEPRNTFLILKDKQYPAKHIRGLAYNVANGREILKSEYSGGEETANFFKKLGFVIQYEKDVLQSTTSQATKERTSSPENNQISNHKIARLIVTGSQYDRNGNANISRLKKVIDKFNAKVYKKQHFEFILTPGGFLTFEFPENLHYNIDVANTKDEELFLLKSTAAKVITNFFDTLSEDSFKKLQHTADFFTIGIDGFNPVNQQHIELVAVFDLKNEHIIQWTGKFYPTEGQKKDLIKIDDFDTHFTHLNKQNIILLGCHDLNVFNPRGQANANPDSWKRKTADKFKERCKDFNPDIILQHPHTTDTPNIWNLAWRTVEKVLPNVKHFASGIKYHNWNGNPRGDLDKVLAKTKKGDVVDFIFDS